MLLETFSHFDDFQLLDTGSGFRLEKWGEAILARPNPQIIWQKHLPESEWQKANAVFLPGDKDSKGRWEIKKPMPDPWIIKHKDIKLLLRLSPFKHTGVFAEQAAQWEWMAEKLKTAGLPKPKILNLFGYTGGATMSLAKAGCFVTHVDASKPAISWANENHKLNSLPENSVRWILEDAAKFAKRELSRGSKYDGIIMDPPAFGHSPSGKTWKFNEDLPGLLETCISLLSQDPIFLIINGYATNSSALSLNNLLEDTVKNIGGKVEFGELCLSQKDRRTISTGIFARWSK